MHLVLHMSPRKLIPSRKTNRQIPTNYQTTHSPILVHSPLFPTQSDLVELAEHVPYDTDSAEVRERHVVVNSAEGGDNARTQEVPTGRPSWTSMWPFSKWYRKDQQTPPSSPGTAVPQQQSPQFITPLAQGTSNVGSNSQRTRGWVPSSSKLSLQIFWWGYRL
jgi:hypothetical protein